MLTRTVVTLLSAALFSAAAPARADVVLEWNGIVVSAVALQNPFAQARIAAIAHLAMFDAVNAVTAEYEPYAWTAAAAPGASPEAAAVAAAHAVLRHYLPGGAAGFDVARESSLAGIAEGRAKSDGIAIGEAVAAALIAARAADGSAPPQFYLPASADPGQWQLTPGCPAAGGILFHWQNVAPFGVENSRQFRSAPPPDLSSARYAKDLAEVSSVGSIGSLVRPIDRADVAQFFNAALAVHVWNQAGRHLASLDGASLSSNARAFALLNMAISDALVTVMETKYHYAFWRPVTAVRAAGDLDFTPFIPTPCFPSYPSAHASASYAALAIARRFWGNGDHSLVLTHPSVPQLTLHYASLKRIAQDIDDARVYGGIHFRFDQDAGRLQGTAIARYIYTHHLRRVD